jgi:FixJ family two-component response regulator
MGARGGRTIYVIDDDDAVRESTAMLLESAGFAVRDFGSAATFLAAFDPADAGCLVIDMHMPGMSGLQLLKTLRCGNDAVPVVLFTARTEEIQEYARKAHSLALLDKPADDERLIQLVRQMMHDGDGH